MAKGLESLRGRSAIVTGGASGIGRALGAALAGAGAHVVLADVDGDAADEAARSIGGTATAAPLDVRDREAVAALVGDVAGRHGSLDLLFNNAGISLGGRTEEMTGAHWDRIIDINLRGVVNGVLAAYPLMIEQGHGHIVNTTSAAGIAHSPLTVPYSTTKHAVTALTTGLRPEAAAHGVRVTLLVPGSIETPIQDKGQPADLPSRPSDVMTGRDFLQTVGGVRMLSADALAAKALDGVVRNRAMVIAPASIKPLWYLQRLSPSLMERVGRVIVRRVNRELDARLASRGPLA